MPTSINAFSRDRPAVDLGYRILSVDSFSRGRPAVDLGGIHTLWPHRHWVESPALGIRSLDRHQWRQNREG